MRYLKINDNQMIVLDENKSDIVIKETEQGVALIIENIYNFIIPFKKIDRFFEDIYSSKFILNIKDYI